ncbi:hypothetical protein PRIPAC_70691, partial [Pristionchus pacificus]
VSTPSSSFSSMKGKKMESEGRPLDEIALVTTIPDSTPVVEGEVSIVIPKAEEMKEVPSLCAATGRPKKTRALIYKYKKTPFTYYQVIALGILLLLIILICVGVETWISGSYEEFDDNERNHSEEDELHFRDLVKNVNEMDGSWKAKYNRFASRSKTDESTFSDTIETIRNMIKLKNRSTDEDIVMGDTEGHVRELTSQRIILPSSFDSRRKWPNCWSVHQIQNQGGCGSCWAVAASAVMSDRLCISSNGSSQALVSAQDLTSCCSACGGCEGTHWALAAFTHWKNRGVVTGGSYGSNEGCKPYEVQSSCGFPCSTSYYEKSKTPTCERKCQPLYEKNYEEDLVKARRAYWLKARFGAEKSEEIESVISKTIKAANLSEVDLIKREIFIHGPVLACFTLMESFQHYERGIYNDSLVESHYLYGHCAKLIGWGEENGIKFWQYANTWGRDWGEFGFFRVVFDDLPEEVVAGLI